jgi:probable phosphoglycerate mutase
MLILARHGATPFNDAGELLGRQPVGLSESGVAEAEALARWLERRYAVVAVHTSDLPRAAQTAAIVARELSVDPVREEPLLAERALGPFEGMSRAELISERGRRGVSLTSPTQDWHGIGEVEPDAEVWRRFQRFARDSGALERARSEDVVAVTHAGVIRSCLHRTFRIPPDRPRCFRVQTGHGLAFAIEPDGLELHEMWLNDARAADSVRDRRRDG